MFRLILFLVVFSVPAYAQNVVLNAPRNNVNVPPPPMQIYVLVDGQQVGPMDADKFQSILSSPEAAASTYVWMPGMAKWEIASTVPQLQGIIAAIGQGDGSDGNFRVTDIQSYSLGVWISQRFVWTLEDQDHHAIIQMKLLPDGKFEGATLFWALDTPNPDINVYHEKGDWTMSGEGDNVFRLERKYAYSQVLKDQLVGTGTASEQFIVSPDGPNALKTKEGIIFVRVPEAS